MLPRVRTQTGPPQVSGYSRVRIFESQWVRHRWSCPSVLQRCFFRKAAVGIRDVPIAASNKESYEAACNC